MAGWIRLRGTLQVPLRGPAQPLAAVRSGACEAMLRKQSALTHVSSVAACSCAQSCAHEQDRGWASCPTRPRHASGPCGSRPRNRTHPAFDRSPRSAVDPRHAWMLFDSHSKYSIPMEIHPRMAWIYCVDQGRHLPTATGICQRWGGVGGQDRWRHGWRHRAPMDGSTACPAHPHRPAIPRIAAVAVAVALSRCRAAGPADPP